MSILIKGMEMPKRCLDCPFMVSRDNDDCILQTEVENELARTWEELKASCPLVEIPTPHGRLIDGDKFYKVMCSHWVLSLGEAYKRLEEFLKKPVIEAEGSEA